MIETFQAHPRFRGFRIDTGMLRAELIELGGIVTRLEVPDRDDAFGNVLLGCPTIADYLGFHPHFNCLVGRYANRIANARFVLDGVLHRLDANLPPHHLHGGRNGFGARLWRGAVDGDAVVLRLASPDGDGGYPGNLDVEARYRFDGTSHHYYNLSANPGATVADHVISVNADAFLPVGADLVQRGEIRAVDGTPFDLRNPVRLGQAMAVDDPQLRLAGNGFDHTFVLASGLAGVLADAVHPGCRRAATVRHPASGRTLAVSTDQPGLQLYTGNALSAAGRHGARYPPHGGLCLETQQFPDAPNHAGYPDAILRPGQTFRACTEFAFSVA